MVDEALKSADHWKDAFMNQVLRVIYEGVQYTFDDLKRLFEKYEPQNANKFTKNRTKAFLKMFVIDLSLDDLTDVWDELNDFILGDEKTQYPNIHKESPQFTKPYKQKLIQFYQKIPNLYYGSLHKQVLGVIGAMKLMKIELELMNKYGTDKSSEKQQKQSSYIPKFTYQRYDPKYDGVPNRNDFTNNYDFRIAQEDYQRYWYGNNNNNNNNNRNYNNTNYWNREPPPKPPPKSTLPKMPNSIPTHLKYRNKDRYNQAYKEYMRIYNIHQEHARKQQEYNNYLDYERKRQQRRDAEYNRQFGSKYYQ